MQDYPIDGSRDGGHRLDPREVAVDRAVLRALLADSSEFGERVETIAGAVGHPADLVKDAVEFLVWLGVVEQNEALVRASGGTLYLAELWQVAG
jgi:hypothetical protein